MLQELIIPGAAVLPEPNLEHFIPVTNQAFIPAVDMLNETEQEAAIREGECVASDEGQHTNNGGRPVGKGFTFDLSSPLISSCAPAGSTGNNGRGKEEPERHNANENEKEENDGKDGEADRTFSQPSARPLPVITAQQRQHTLSQTPPLLRFMNVLIIILALLMGIILLF